MGHLVWPLSLAVVAPREAAIDSEHLRILSSIARERAQSSRGELVVFEAPVYCEKLVSDMMRLMGQTM